MTYHYASMAVPYHLPSMLSAAYFSITTLTTVGLGDIVPLTPGGRLTLVFEMVAAVTVIPLELAALSKALLPEVINPAGDAVQLTGDGACALNGELVSPAQAQLATLGDVSLTRRQCLTCTGCALTDHEADAIFCRRCGEILPAPQYHASADQP